MRSLYAETAMSVEQVNEKMLSVTPALKGIADIWRNSELRNFRVTSVGMAIGHANIKRRLPELSHLGTWVQ